MNAPSPGEGEPSAGGTPKESVRAAGIGDQESLLRLGEELVELITAHRGGSLLVESGRRASREKAGLEDIGDLLVDAGSHVVLGTLDDVVVGFAVCHLEEGGGSLSVSTPGSGRRGVFDACYVEPEARGVGVGSLLLEASLSWLTARGCQGVDGTALPGDRGAKNFYESAGFKARMLTMYRELD